MGGVKAEISSLIESYNRTKSVWATGREFGMCGQGVWERLKRAKALPDKTPEFTEEQKNDIRETYASGFTRGDGKLDLLCSRIGKSKANICRFAKRNGLTNAGRKFSADFSEKNKRLRRGFWTTRKHPRGMLGKKHTSETLQRLSEASLGRKMTQEAKLKMSKTKIMRGKLYTHRKGCSWKGGWRDVGGKRIYFRSRWEANYARYLEFLKERGEIYSWEHEPQTFWFEGVKRGTVSYLPDFKVVMNNGETEFHEVKGWMDAASKTKLKRMAKYHPNVKMVLRDSKWYCKNARTLSAIVAGWE